MGTWHFVKISSLSWRRIEMGFFCHKQQRCCKILLLIHAIVSVKFIPYYNTEYLFMSMPIFIWSYYISGFVFFLNEIFMTCISYYFIWLFLCALILQICQGLRHHQHQSGSASQSWFSSWARSTAGFGPYQKIFIIQKRQLTSRQGHKRNWACSLALNSIGQCLWPWYPKSWGPVHFHSRSSLS